MEISTPNGVEQYLDSFITSLASRQYKPSTLKNYLSILRGFAHLLKYDNIATRELSLELAAELARRLPASPKGRVKAANVAQLFVEHLIDIGVTEQPQLTAALTERLALRNDLENYLLKQRGISTRSTKHVLGFATRFLSWRFGDEIMDLAALSSIDVVAFMEHVVARKTPYRDKTLSSHLRSFFQYLFAKGLITKNLSLCVPRVHKPWGSRLPRYLSPDDINTVLAVS